MILTFFEFSICPKFLHAVIYVVYKYLDCEFEVVLLKAIYEFITDWTNNMKSILIFVSLILASHYAKADLVLTMGGDVNLAKDERYPEAPVYTANGDLAPKAQQPSLVRTVMQTESVFRELLTGDINFGNLETVVSDDYRLKPYGKTFTFMTHPGVVKILTDYGFNLFSTANNHVFDYNEVGATDTLRNLTDLKQEIEKNSLVNGHPSRSLYHAGLAANINDATEPAIFEINGVTIAFGAIGFGGVSTGSDEGSIVKYNPGIIAIHNKTLVDKLLQNIANSKANLKILSVHSGIEGVFELDKGQRARYHEYLNRGDLDLIIGHHPHVVRPVENVNGKLIFYSLGNYFMTGAANRDGKGVRGNYGLFSKVYFEKRPDQNRINGFRLTTEAAELIPLTHMHANISTKGFVESSANLNDLKELSRSELGSEALPFDLNNKGTGVYCSSQIQGERAQKLCGQTQN
jgi:poly-gamma-glutamate synthesis protein (capsule biosynthesis protein)